MKKTIKSMMFVSCLLAGTLAMAQSVPEGVTHLYAQRNKSAKAAFEKLLATNPNNIEATYWLGQTLIEMDDLPGARSVYEKALTANGNAPLLLAGMGHIELLENKPSDARQRFETAISLSRTRRGDDPEILNAVGRANIDAVDTKLKSGDLNYAVEKLNIAAQRDAKNPATYLNLGNAYRKLHNGSMAVLNYTKAVEARPNFAIASYRIAKIYETQKNWEPYVRELEAAIAADSKFAPAYYELYYYNLGKLDFNKAQEYANKYLAPDVTDPDIQNDYLKAQTAWAKKDYASAIQIAQNIINVAGDKTDPRTYKLLAYSYVDKGDTIAAKPFIDQYFAKESEEEIVGLDYILQADIYAALPDNTNPNIVRDSYLKAAALDSVYENKVKLLQQGIDRFKATNKKIAEAELRLALIAIKTNPNPTEYFFAGLPLYQGGDFKRADSVFKIYSKAMPDSVFGHLWSARALANIDTTLELGLAVPEYKETLRVSQVDKMRLKAYGIEASGYLAGYYNNILKEKDSAIAYLEKGLEFDPTNEAIQKNLDILRGTKSSGSKPGQPKPTSGTNKASATTQSGKK